MAWIWTGMAVVSVVCGAVYGRMEAVSAAALEGAGQAVRLCLSMAGVLGLWTGLMEVMDRCGLSRRLGRLFRPVLRRLLPQASRDPETLAAVTANVSANLLGLGNACAYSERGYLSDTTDTYFGEALAVVRADADADTVELTAADGTHNAACCIPCKE